MDKQQNRNSYPETAKIVDEVRECFPDAKLVNSTELPDWRERAKKYNGTKVHINRKWVRDYD